MTVDTRLIATEWLSALASALEQGNALSVAMLFIQDGWLRDAFALNWDLRTLEGRDQIAKYLSGSLKTGEITDVHLDDDPLLSPRICTVPLLQDLSNVEFGFQFSLPYGHGRGLARLVQEPDGTFRALTVLLALHGLGGHEELKRLPLRDTSGRNTDKAFADWVHEVETNPLVLIVGGGHTGLDMAARFKQMNVSSLVIEKNTRVGDNWRSRYPTLALHSHRRASSLLYQAFPSTWPDYTPRSKFASWLEQYATTQDLVVWTNAELQAHPRYNESSGKWDVIVIRDGVEVKLRPSHLVMATGFAGRPVIPAIPGLDQFRGQHMHSSEFPGGARFTGQRAVVIGAAESAIDICQDLVLEGAGSVTMVQRSETCVVGRDYFNMFWKQLFPEDASLEVSDFKFVALPLSLQQKLVRWNRQAIADAHEEMHNNLRKGGLNVADPGVNPYTLFYDRGGGYWCDKGGAELIGNGSIKIKSGTSVGQLTNAGLVMQDGTELPADVVVFATGVASMRESTADLLGPEVMKRVGPVGGRDAEGEINGLYRPCGHPGLWFAGGDLVLARAFSRHLGLQIQASELGLIR